MIGGQTGYMAVHKSLDGGETFTTHSIYAAPSGLAYAVAAHPLDDNIIYAGGYYYSGGATKGGVFRSTSGGSDWENVTGDVLKGFVYQISVNPLAPEIIFVRAGNSIYKSTDAGASWSKMASFAVTCFKVNPEVPDEIYASAPDDFYVSVDGGTTWTSIGSGLDFQRILCIDLVPSVKMLYVGTDGAGAYQNRRMPLYMLAIRVGAGGGTGGTTDPSPGVYGYEEGSGVDVAALPTEGYTFQGWTGDFSGLDNPLRVTMDGDKTIGASFSLVAPSDFRVRREVVRSVFLVQYIHVLTWQRILNVPTVAGYRIYLMNGDIRTFLGEVGPNVSTYWHRGVSGTGAKQYALVAVSDDGQEGEASYATVGVTPDLIRRTFSFIRRR